MAPEDTSPRRKYSVGVTPAAGGQGMVLKALDLDCRRDVAMKVIQPGLDADADATARFLAEARITAQLEHPNIVPVHDLGADADGNLYHTMKLIRGLTLRRILDAIAAGDGDISGRYPLRELLTIFLKVCDAVAFAHSRGVIHRDLKPDNIMVGEFGEVQVMDWGLAKVLRHGDGGASDLSDPSDKSDLADKGAAAPACAAAALASAAATRKPAAAGGCGTHASRLARASLTRQTRRLETGQLRPGLAARRGAATAR